MLLKGLLSLEETWEQKEATTPSTTTTTMAPGALLGREKFPPLPELGTPALPDPLITLCLWELSLGPGIQKCPPRCWTCIQR